MPTALILSSHVASSRVGGGLQALALAALGIEPVLVPTVLFGRHPGLGPPGGAAVAAETFQGVLDGAEANGALGAELMIVGYFASAPQVQAAAAAIDRMRAMHEGRRPPLVVVDPIMGDSDTGLYVRPEVAEAVALELVPRADLLCPNAWELERLTGARIRDPASAVAAARRLQAAVLVSSVDCEDGLGVVYADHHEAWLAAHGRAAQAPKGTGDLLTALFAARRLGGQSPAAALAHAAGGLFETIAAAGAAADLPILGMGGRLDAVSGAIRLERLD